MKWNYFPLSLAGALLFALSAKAQKLEAFPPIEEPVLAASESPAEVARDVLAEAASSMVAPPAPPRLQSQFFASPSIAKQRSALQAFATKRHQFVHCKLGNGKILTGLPRDVGEEGFSLHTDALGETYIRYETLVEMPRPVPAIGTRIKQGAQWTGIGALIVFAIPILVVFSPILYLSGWDC